MAHNIEILGNGDACFVESLNNGTISPAWHGLGDKYENPLTIEAAMRASHADFIVEKQPVLGVSPELMQMINNGDTIDASQLKDLIIKNHTCNMRMTDNKIFAITSDKYGVVQNQDAFHFINNICGMDEKQPTIDTMGVLNDGTTFATIRMNALYDLGKDDAVDMYLVVRNSFNNKEAFTVFTAFQRVVCQNTLNAAFNGANSKITFKHTKNVNSRLDAEIAAHTLGFYEKYKQAFIENMERLKTIKLNDKQCELILAKSLMNKDVFDAYEKSGFNLGSDDLSTMTKNKMSHALEILHTGIGQQECRDKGTGLWLYNGMTTLINNHTKFKSDEKKFDSIFGGTADNNQQTCFNEIIKLAA